MAADDLQRLRCATIDDWDAWLAEHHAESSGVWLQVAKQGRGIDSVGAKEAVSIALRWGWIDGQLQRLDDDWYLVRYTPRRARSVWSRINVGRAEQLIAEGRMQPAGLAQVEAARTDGRWDAAYAGSATMDVPPELQAALDAHPTAAAAFAALDRASRYAMCWRVYDAKRAATKARRVEQYVGMLERGERIR